MATGLTTICLVGFPADGVHPRELKNLCRFMPGFEGAHVAFAGVGIPSTLFVKFQTPELATASMETLHGVPFDVDNPQFTLKAEWARREMEVRPHSPLPAPLVAAPGGVMPYHHAQHVVPRPAGPPPTQFVPISVGYPGRMAATGGELVTIVVFGLKEKGLHPGDLETFFRERAGFVSLQMNDRIDGMFVRFASGPFAEKALHEANAQQVGAEWARRNLDDERNGTMQVAYQPAPAPIVAQAAPVPYGGYAGPPSRRIGATGGELVTICVLGLPGKDIPADQMQEWFAQRPGFDRQQLNDRIGGLFVKFTNCQHAEQAMTEANQMGYGAEWARRNLDDDLSARGAPMTMYQHQQIAAVAQVPQLPAWGMKGGAPPKRIRTIGGEIDTITILAIREKEQTHGNLQQWFADRPGYVALQLNDKIGAMFVKFSSRQAAEQAIVDANANQIGAEWAYRNLDL